jgi:Mce-associated membrane protein
MSTNSEQADKTPRQVNPYLIAAIALLVVALAAALVFGIRWISAANDDDAKFSVARDDVLRVGEQMAINFTSIDYQKLDQFKKEMADNTTGQLHDQIGKTIDQYKSKMSQNKVSATSTLMEGAVVSLDLHSNKAQVMAVVNSTSKGADAKQSPPQRLPIVIGLTRTGDGAPWKAESVTGAPTAGGQ